MRCKGNNMKLETSMACPPPPLSCVCFWERGLDPFHRDAFSEIKEIYYMLPFTFKKRKEGWNGIDHSGNPVHFMPDGTIIEKYDHNWIIGESYKGTLCAVRDNFIDEFKRAYKNAKT